MLNPLTSDDLYFVASGKGGHVFSSTMAEHERNVAAYRLTELGHEQWAIYERADHVGGLSSSYRDPYGFIWDHGGHVMFSHYRYFDDLVEKIHQKHTDQRTSDPFAVDLETPVEIEPVLPGCDCHPPRVVTRLGQGDLTVTFRVVGEGDDGSLPSSR